MKTIALILLLCCLVIGCGSSQLPAQTANTTPSPKPSPSPRTPQQKSAIAEQYLQEDEDSDNRIEVRKAVVEYVKSNLSNQKIEGVSLLSYTGNLYIASVDLSEKEKRQTISLIVRMYVKENGETYWKADKLSEDDKRLLISRKAYRLNGTEQKLSDAQAKTDELEEELAARDETPDDSSYEPPDDPRN
jgi:predicted Zn-dependent protease